MSAAVASAAQSFAEASAAAAPSAEAAAVTSAGAAARPEGVALASVGPSFGVDVAASLVDADLPSAADSLSQLAAVDAVPSVAAVVAASSFVSSDGLSASTCLALCSISLLHGCRL